MQTCGRSTLRRLRPLAAMCGFALGLIHPALAFFPNGPTYTISTVAPTSIPAGVAGASLTISGTFPAFSATSYGVCFQTNGPSSPIIPSPTQFPNVYTVAVPAASIQSVPPNAFSGGSYPAQMYVSVTDSTCQSANPTLTNVVTVPILYPTISRISVNTIPQSNPNLGQGPPYNITFTGSEYNANTVVQITSAAGNSSPPVHLISLTSLLVPLPTNIPSNAPNIAVSLCNQSPGFSYCAPTQTINLTALDASFANLTAAPNPALVNGNVTLKAQFIPGTSAIPPGAPTGQVRFSSNGTAFAAGRLILDPGANSSFDQLSNTITSASANSLKIADFNADGIPDAVYLDASANIHVLLGTTPAGTFLAEITTVVNASCSIGGSVVVGDLNKDGYPDLVVTCTSASGGQITSILFGNGDGTFSPAFTLPGVFGSQIALADVNKDGNLDIVAAGATAAGCGAGCYGIALFLGDGTGNFAAGTVTPFASNPFGPIYMVDLDGDGYPDYVTLVNGSTNAVQIYRNTPEGNFITFGQQSGTSYIPSATIPLPAYPANFTNVVFGNFYTSGLPDIAVGASQNPSGFLTAKNTSTSGSISFAAPVTQPFPAFVNGIAAGDFNGDGFTDIVISSNGTVQLQNGDGFGNFATVYTGLSYSQAQANFNAVVATDLNNDGDSDLVMAIFAGGQNTLLSLITSGSATASTTTSFPAPGAYNLSSSWIGNTNILGSPANYSEVVNAPLTSTGTALTTSLSPAEYGQPVKFTATVTPVGGGSPTGTVNFFSGAASIGTGSLVNGVATLTTSALVAGNDVISAVYSGDSSFATSTSSNLTEVITKAQPTVLWNPNPATIPYGTPLSAAQLDATAKSNFFASVPGSFTYTPAAGAVLTAGTQSLSVTFTPTDTVNFASANGTASIVVTQATPTVTWSQSLPPIHYGDALSGAQLNATAAGVTGAALPGAFVYNPAAGTLLTAGNQLLSVTFTPSDTVNYTSATATTHLLVNQFTPTINWPTPAPVIFGTALDATQLDAVASGIDGTIPGTYTYTPAAGTVLGAGNDPGVTGRKLSVTFTPADAVNYAQATASVLLIVDKAPPQLTYGEPLTATYGEPLSAAQLNGTARGYDGQPLPGTFVYNPDFGAILPAGNYTVTFTFTPTDSADYLTGGAQYGILVVPATPTIQWSAPAPIAAGTPLSATQLDAVALGYDGNPLPGAFTYSPPAGTVLPVGPNQALSVSFSPTDANDYVIATGNTAITVLPPPPTTTLRITAGGSTVSTVASPTVVTLTASVANATAPVFPGQVRFCDGPVAFCTDIHLLGAAQLTSGGQAVLRFVPAIGTHSYTAVFLGTHTSASSSSAATPLLVSGLYPTSTSLSQSGSPGNYTLTGTVIGSGSEQIPVTGTLAFTDTTANSVLATAPLTASTSSLNFSSSNSPATGTLPLGVAVADFNGDGKADIVTANTNGTQPGPSNLTILLANGDGTFSVSPYRTSGSSYAVATGDFNNDGKPDLVVLGQIPGSSNDSLTVLLGNGDGTFTPGAANSFVGRASYAVAVADFNGDGNADLAITNSLTSNVTILLGNGDGSFSAASALATPAATAYIAAGDLNGDGRPDLVVTYVGSQSTSVGIFLGNGDGTFTPASSSPTVAASASALALGDFNRDGKLDLATTNQTANTVTVLFGAGDGTFPQSNTFPTDAGPYSILVADLNGDGIADLVTGNLNESVSVLLNDGEGSFKPPQNFHSKGATVIAAGDFNSDGIPDIAAPSETANYVVTLLTQRLQTATATVTNLAPAGTGTHQVTANYPGDTHFASSVSAPTALVLGGSSVIITWPTPAPIVFGTPLSAVQLNATASVPGVFTYFPSAGTIFTVGSHPISLSFTPTDPNLSVVVASNTVTVTRATPAVTFNPPAPIVYGTPLSATQLNASALGYNGNPLPGVFTYTPPAGTVLPVGTAQPLSVTFTPNDTLDYVTSTAATVITVTKATPTIIWPTPAPIAFGTALSATQLDASATGIGNVALPGAFVYTPAAGTKPSAGSQTLSVTFTPADAVDYNVATATTTLVVTKAAPSITFNAPASIPYGTALSATQLNASATGLSGALPGTFVYTPPAGTVLPAGPRQTLSVTFTPTDLVDYSVGAATTSITVTQATPTVTFNAPAAIVYGTPLSATQLNASATGLSGALPGTFTYTPAAGTVLTVGSQPLSVTFTPADAVDYTTAFASTSITVSRALPTVTWNTPAPIVTGTPLSATQLNATATGAGGASVPGAFVYTPPAGTVLPTGSNQTLSVTFTPTDLLDYGPVTTTTTIGVFPLAVTSIAPTFATLGDPAKTITLTGTGFLANSVVQINGASIPTTFVSPTSLTAVIPASYFTSVQSLTVAVNDPTQGRTSAATAFAVIAPPPGVIFTGPPTAPPGAQPALTFTLTNPYPVILNGTLTLTFAGAGGVDDPAIQFAAGGRSSTFTIPANSVATPAIQLQSGTDSGVITVTLTLTAAGQNVTPASVQPIVITVPAIAPVLATATLERNGNTLTVLLSGFSNTREVSAATFHFDSAGGAPAISNPDITIPATSLFSAWFSTPGSQSYGSTFLYTQDFNLNDGAVNIGQVTLTLTNTAGVSTQVVAK